MYKYNFPSDSSVVQFNNSVYCTYSGRVTKPSVFYVDCDVLTNLNRFLYKCAMCNIISFSNELMAFGCQKS